MGLEEELHVVDAETLALAPRAEDLLAELGGPGATIGFEAYAAQIELRTHPQATVEEAVDELRRLRAGAAGAAERLGLRLLAAGLHPDARFGEVVLMEKPRYARAGAEMRGLLRRTPEAALHVHIGVPDAQTALRAHNRLRAGLPDLIARAANSPWWLGVDTGLASARYAAVRAYPGRGVPPHFASYSDYEAALAAIADAGGPDDYTLVWWDVRPHPRLGTVEVRELDAQTKLEDVASVAELVLGLAHEGAERESPPEAGEPIAWRAFLAARDGAEGCGATRQRAIYTQSGMPGLLEHLTVVPAA